MTITLYWAFAVLTFISPGQGASCGIGWSAEYQDQATCEYARQTFDNDQLLRQTPTRRISTLPCEEKVRR